MSEETIFFQEGEILVINARFVVGAQTFAMRTVTSVKGEMTPANYSGAVLLVLTGLVVALIAFFNLAITIGILGIFIFCSWNMDCVSKKADLCGCANNSWRRNYSPC
jgi:hypothetical protein